MTGWLSWENPPTIDDPTLPTREEIAEMLTQRRGTWAVVARHDRAARCAAHVVRIADGREYGDGFTAVARCVGNEHRVYAIKR